jgi:hypothetical protein
VKTQTDVANPDEYEVVIMVTMWWVFSMQRGPVEKKKEMITEIARWNTKVEEVKAMEKKT